MAVELEDKTRLKWRTFLASPDGQAGLLFLREKIPGINPSGMTSDQIILQAGITEGFKRAIDTISDVITFTPPSPADWENPSTISR